jgi:hypothetical protein
VAAHSIDDEKAISAVASEPEEQCHAHGAQDQPARHLDAPPYPTSKQEPRCDQHDVDDHDALQGQQYARFIRR